MRWITEWRASRGVAVACGVSLALMGCNKPAPAGKGIATSGTGTATTTGGGPSEKGIRQAGDDVLKLLGEGKIGPGQLTPGFRAEIAPPATDEEKKAGYSESSLKKFLARFEGGKFPILEDGTVGSYLVFRGRAEFPGGKDAFSIRLLTGGEAPLIDWLHRTDKMAVGVPKQPTAELGLAAEVARDFLALLIGIDPTPAQPLMSLGWRKGLAPAAPGSKSEYEAGFLAQQMKSWRAGAVGYSITKAELLPNKSAAVFSIELEADGKKLPYVVRMALENNRWTVTAFDKQ